MLEKSLLSSLSEKEKVTEKLKEGVSKLAVDIDQNRFEQELIYYIEKYDITEEIVRLKIISIILNKSKGERNPLEKNLDLLHKK